jgi:hypothetical protein
MAALALAMTGPALAAAPPRAAAPPADAPSTMAFPSPDLSVPEPEPGDTFADPPPVAWPRLVELRSPEATWLDEGHSFIERTIFWPFVQADHFFADDRAVDADLATSYVRWRNDLRLHRDGRVDYQTALRMNLAFPYLARRLDKLRITVAGQSADALDRLLPGDTPVAGPTGQISAGLGLTFLESLRSQSDAQVGLLFDFPLGWYVRLRFRHAHELGSLGLGRASLSGFWQTNTGWGTREELSLERLLQPWLVARLASGATLTEKSRGLEWGAEAALLATVGPSTALGLAGGPSGATQTGVIEVWQATARARRDVFRRWLFLELAPQITWTYQPGGGQRRDELILLRLEVQFQETRASRDS